MKVMIGMVCVMTLSTCASRTEARFLIGSGEPPANRCGNQASPPKIISSAIVAPGTLDAGGNPPPGTWEPSTGRLETKGIEYISGDLVQVDLVTDGCTEIQQIVVGSQTLTPTASFSGTQPNVYWYSSIDTTNDVTTHGYHISVGYPRIFDGTAEGVAITVQRAGGTGTASYSFPVVHVALVEPIRTIAPVGISSTELYNEFAAGLYEKFGGAANSVIINKHRLYDYDPSSLGVYVDSTGVWISFKFKVDSTGCDPTVRVSGTFTLDANPPGTVGLKVRWVNPILASFACNVPIYGGVWEAAAQTLGAETGAAQTVQQSLTDEITGSLPSFPLLLSSVWTGYQELRVNLLMPGPSVEINLPYDAFDMGRGPMVFPPNQLMLVVAHGLGMNDFIAGVTPQTSLWSGPNGVPLVSANPMRNSNLWRAALGPSTAPCRWECC